MKTALVLGAGGFIGGHWVKHLLKKGYNVTAQDIKPFEEWYQIHGKANNIEKSNASDFETINLLMFCKDEIYNFACNMGGIAFCENNHLMTGLSIGINTAIITAALIHNPYLIFYSSSACVYNELKQKETNSPALIEADAWPAQPDLLYGMEKLFSEELYRYLFKEYSIPTYIARLHNVYGPLGTWAGGREKAPAAAIRKILVAKREGGIIVPMWGDGKQTRSFMYIDDCIEGIDRIVNCSNLVAMPINLGSDELVSIQHLHDIATKIADYSVNYFYSLNAPQGVRGRNSDNTFIESVLNWKPSTTLLSGMKKTYDWILSDFDNADSPFRINHELRW